jgi:hypothetical protein
MATTPAYFAQNPDVAAAYKENTYGLTPQEFADTHFALYGQAEQRAAPAAAAVPVVTTPTAVTPVATTPMAATPAPPTLPTYFTQNPDVAAAYKVNNYGLTPQQFADAHYAKFGINEQRISPTGAPAIIPTKTVTTPVTPLTPVTPVVNRTTTGSSLPYFQLNPDVAASYLTNSYGMTPEQFAAAHYAKYGQFEQRVAPSTSPFANATQGFAQNFQNYQSIPIGAQYNPNVVGGTGSPYSQIMGQMKPFQNPYQNFVANTPMGGYDPGLYDRIEAANLAKAQADAEIARLGGTPVYGSDANGGDTAGIGSQGGDSAGNTGGGPGTGADGDAAFAKGGMVRSLLGPDPQGPDDGMGYLDKGEYVIKKSAVNKYGKGLLDMINDGKVPAKKMKSLLG